MRKLAKVLLAGVAALSLTACGQAEGTTGSCGYNGKGAETTGNT